MVVVINTLMLKPRVLAPIMSESHIGRSPFPSVAAPERKGPTQMTIHRIRLLGDPILRARCEPITKPGSTAVRVILDDMRAMDRPQGLDPFCLREEWHRLHGPEGRYGPPEDRNTSYATPITDVI